MKIVTNDYGCGTSSSILDYGTDDVIVVSESNWEHVFDTKDDLFFVGHDFLLYMWDTQEKIERWKKFQYAKILWCFERIDAIFQSWRQKSHYSLSMASQIMDKVFACDEDDCDNYGFQWLPQWGSCKFFDQRHLPASNPGILFSGQAGKPEYRPRTELLVAMQNDAVFKDKIKVTNVDRTLSWDDYIKNLLSYNTVLNPYGVLRALNTRAYEVLYSGRLLLQHEYGGKYKRHRELLEQYKNVIFFSDLKDLKSQIKILDIPVNNDCFVNNNLEARLKLIQS